MSCEFPARAAVGAPTSFSSLALVSPTGLRGARKPGADSYRAVWMSHGVRGDFTDYRCSSFLRSRPNGHFAVFQTGALPQLEVPLDFQSTYVRLLAQNDR